MKRPSGYWIDLLRESETLTAEQYQTIHPDAEELVKLLVYIVRTSKEKPNA